MKKILICFITITFCLFNYIEVKAEDLGYISEYVYLYDLDSKQVLIDQGSTERIYPASMTKMMTLIVAIENIDNVEETILITEEMLAGLKEANASRAGFDVGDEPKLIDLMYGVNLPSGADCTNALAFKVSGGLSGFVELMNNKAKEIGMNDTNFMNVTGLHDDNHYSTLQDIAKLMEYCLKNELWTKIFTTEKYTSVPVQSDPDGLEMVSVVFKYINHPEDATLKYHASIEGFLGAKSGYTNEARYCLASIAERNGIKYVLITAHAWETRVIPSHILDAEIIYNYYFDNFTRHTFYNTNDLIMELPVNYNFFNNKIKIYAQEDIVRIIKNNADINIEMQTEEALNAPISPDESIGFLRIFEDDNLIYETNLYPSQKIDRQFFAYILTNICWFMLENKFKIIAFLTITVLLTLLIRKIIEKGN